jgi:hypothetical protein
MSPAIRVTPVPPITGDQPHHDRRDIRRAYANSVCAGIILVGTDFGTAPHRLAALFTALSAEIADGFTRMFTLAGPALPETQPVRRAFVIDETLRESAQLRPHRIILQAATR